MLIAMARYVRSLRALLPHPSSTICSRLGVAETEKRIVLPNCTARTYISEMRKSAFEGTILRLLRNEVQYELEHNPPAEPVNAYESFTVDDRSGEQWIRLKKKFGDSEDIKVEATMFDGAIPVSKSAATTSGGDMQLHITLVVSISKKAAESGDDVLEFMCSAWPDSLEINKLFVRGGRKMQPHLYPGPDFKELDDELQESLYEFLEARGVNDELAGFLHRYMKNKDRTEFVRWMGTVMSFIEKKQ